MKKRHSFIKTTLTQKIVDKLVFIDTEFTFKNEETKVKSPVSIAMINYKGEFLMNIKINPQGRVLFFGTIMDYRNISQGKWKNTNAS